MPPPHLCDTRKIEDALGVLLPDQAGQYITTPALRVADAPPLRIGDYLDILAPRLPAGLVPLPAQSGIRRLAGELPGNLTHVLVWEVRLAANENQVDFSFSVLHQEREVLAGQRPACDLPAKYFANPHWQNIRRLASVWSNPSSPINRRVYTLWLEFDQPYDLKELLVPGVFLATKIHHKSWSVRQDLDWLTNLALPTLQGKELQAGSVHLIRKIVGNLPTGANIFQIGVMLNRVPPTLRICVRDLDLHAYAEFLQRIGYRGPIDRVQDLVKALHPLVDQMSLDLDVDETLGTLIGIEGAFDRRSNIVMPALTTRLMDWLVENGWCDPQKHQAVLGFPGYLDNVTNANEWPLALAEATRRMGGRYRSVLRCNLSHVKLVIKPQGVVEAKAYLIATHNWIEPLQAVKAELAFRPQPI